MFKIDYKPKFSAFPDFSQFPLHERLLGYGVMTLMVILFLAFFIFFAIVLHKIAKFFLGRIVYVFYVLAFIVIIGVLDEIFF